MTFNKKDYQNLMRELFYLEDRFRELQDCCYGDTKRVPWYRFIKKAELRGKQEAYWVALNLSINAISPGNYDSCKRLVLQFGGDISFIKRVESRFSVK